MSYLVTAPYVTLRVRDQSGKDVVLGFYKDAPLPDSVNREDLERHLRKGMVADSDAKAKADEAQAAEEAKKVAADKAETDKAIAAAKPAAKK